MSSDGPLRSQWIHPRPDRRRRDFEAFEAQAPGAPGRGGLSSRAGMSRLATVQRFIASSIGPSFCASRRSATWRRWSGSMPIRWASKAAWWIFDRGMPLGTRGWPSSSCLSRMMWAASSSRGSGGRKGQLPRRRSGRLRGTRPGAGAAGPRGGRSGVAGGYRVRRSRGAGRGEADAGFQGARPSRR